MGKRSYGTGRLFVRCDSGGREVWYGTRWAGGVRVKRRIALKRSTGRADGLTREMTTCGGRVTPSYGLAHA